MDRLNKNQSLVDKVNVMAGLMNQIPDKTPERKRIPQKKKYVTEGPEEQRILLEELPKVLFLNNKEPRKVHHFSIFFEALIFFFKYNLQFWAKHFNIEPQKLRNIFNFVSYAIPDITNEKETGRVLRFILE